MASAAAFIPAAVAAALLASGVSSLAAKVCHSVPLLRTENPSAFVAGRYRVRFDNPDSEAMPTLWEGPMQVDDSERGTRCRVDLEDLINAPLVALDGGLLLLSVTSGSNMRVVTVDLRRCAVRYASRKLTGPLTLEGGVVRAAGTPVPHLPCDRFEPGRGRVCKAMGC